MTRDVCSRITHRELGQNPAWNDPGFGSALADGAEPRREQLAGQRCRLLAALQDTNLSIERRFT
jgi:hypothetical protein